MNKPVSAKHLELVTKLREIFQIDRPELDFGIYRILNARASEINDYLQNRLLEKVRNALGDGAQAQKLQVAQELQEKEAQYRADGMNPDGVPRVKELREKLAQYSAGSNEHENAVFSHLLTFFSRYYDNGDFISQRRYKGDTYAIPYSGEEVMLHWSNKDQYYTKSGENFSNYTFKLDDGRTVHFRLVAADTAKDNRKDNDKERRFALVNTKTITRLDDNGDEVEEQVLPVEEVPTADGGTQLIVRFDYAPQAKGTKQEALVAKAVEAVLQDPAVKARWLDLGSRAPTEKNPQRTLLEKHLGDYTTKNTADYFIHKDLGGFLRRELDFYIKNEIMHLDDVQNAGAFADIEKNLRMIQCLRSIALELINFLAQLEDFQRKLWLKRKFVVSSHYCITLDRVPQALWPDVVANARQWAQWKQLGVWDGDLPGTLANLKASPYRMVDTALFSRDFADRLVSEIGSIDESLNGVLVHGDNFQALKFLNNRFNQSIGCTYIDPPYNAPNSLIAYKNNFKHSSFLSLIDNRLRAGQLLSATDGALVIAIDKNEENGVSRLVSEIFPANDNVLVTVEHNRKGVQGDHFSYTNEYAIFSIPKSRGDLNQVARDECDYEYSNLRNWGGESLRTDAANCFYPIYVRGEDIVGFGDVWFDRDKHPIGANVLREDGIFEVFPIDGQGIERKWRYERGTVESIKSRLKVDIGRSGVIQIKIAKVSDQFKTVWYSPKYNAGDNGTQLAKQMGIPIGEFDYPKSIHTTKDCVFAVSSNSDWVLDYFSGSGTTGQAVITLNREVQGSQRKYILVEQGEYFESVLKARLQKIVYAATWADGAPTNQESGISHCFKVLKLESYEDTLNNLQLRRTPAQGDLLNQLPDQAKDDYLLRYMLDVESRGSLLSIEDFKKPFDYSLNIAVDSAGAFEPRKVDLVETFNYLIGLRVKHIDAQPPRGFVTVTGTLPSGESCLVLWRDCEKINYDELRRMANRLDIEAANNPYAVIYINGDHNIPASYTPAEGEEAIGWAHKIRPVEPEFLERMFSMEDI
jgi:adenine-specific DNA-methyltransferase